MKILVLTSGGDAPGMNMVLAQLYRRFGRSLYAARAGFRGLINNDILPISEFNPKKYARSAGSCIKCSRCPEFQEEKYYALALENAKRFDAVIVLGGNGSQRGCRELCKNGVRAVFIPSTIVNDVVGSDYSQGFHTAVSACTRVIDNVMPSMEAFNRCCLIEVMGRNCGAIARNVFHVRECDYLIAKDEDIDYDKIMPIVNEKHQSSHSSCIIVKEKLSVSLDEIAKEITLRAPNIEVSKMTVGYLQRGTAPTFIDIEFACQFAQHAAKVILKTNKSASILARSGEIVIEYYDGENEI